MRLHHTLLGLCLLAGVIPCVSKASNLAGSMKAEPNLRPLTVSHEVTADSSYVSGVKVRMGNNPFGRITEQADSLKYVASLQLNPGMLLRLGGDWQRFSFGVPPGAPIPNTLQSVAMVVGADLDLSDGWLLRIETEPGFYSDFRDISFSDFNSPIIVGFSYLQDENVQWFFGLSVNVRRSIPVFPAMGVRWKFADQWTLMCVLPKPRLEFQALDNLTWYVGGELKGDTYTTGRDFGNQFGIQRLNNTSVDYTEIRIGSGISWRVHQGVSLDLEGGCMVDREFDYHRPDIRIASNGVAPYVQLALHAGF